MKRSLLLLKDEPSGDKATSGLPYFIECIRRKTPISSETCMHIQNSILIFKQYQKSVQLVKGKIPNPKVPPETESIPKAS